MAARIALVLAGLLLLAGCTAPPEVPDDAVTATDPAVPGLTLSSWMDDGDRLILWALAENDGSNTYRVRDGCGQPWVSTIMAENGSVIDYQEIVPCNLWHWEDMLPGDHKTFTHSWDRRSHDPWAKTSEPVAPGNYTWTLRFELQDDVRFLATELPFTLEA